MADQRMIDMDEPIRCTYIDLDQLIERCGMNGRQEVTVTLLMLGYSCGDIAEMINCSRQEIQAAFKRAILKIIRCNNAGWKKVCEGVLQKWSVV